jgi:hypothetical protein
MILWKGVYIVTLDTFGTKRTIWLERIEFKDRYPALDPSVRGGMETPV